MEAEAQRVGLHLHGRRVVREGPIQEDEPRRFYYHTLLAKAAKQGVPEDAERVLDEMRRCVWLVGGGGGGRPVGRGGGVEGVGQALEGVVLIGRCGLRGVGWGWVRAGGGGVGGCQFM